MKQVNTIGVLLGAVAMIATSNSHADLKVKSQGELALESRAFFPEGDGKDYNVAMAGRLTIDAKLKPFKLRVRGFGRHDEVDRNRSALFPEEVWLELKEDALRIRVGYQMLNWTATEAFHPADILNSRYLDGNVQNPEKIGELMAAARLKFLDGNVEAFFMPVFRQPILPSSRSRYRFSPLGVTLGETLVIDQGGELTDDRVFPQRAVRVHQTFRGADVSLHLVQHVDRSLPLVFIDPATMQPQLVFQWVTQIGGTYQQVLGPVLAKVEAAYRDFKSPRRDSPAFGQVSDRDHTLVAAGLEWGFAHESGGESTFLAEAQSAFGLDDESQGSLMLFQRDLLFGYRYARGDVNDQSVLASVIVDLEDPEKLFGAVEYSRRLGETWRAQPGLRIVRFPPKNPDQPVGPEFLHNANYLYINLTRFF